VRFDLGENPQGLKVPHMGWNVISPAKQHGLFDNLGHEPRFYFVHSYHVVCRDQGDALATTHHGYDFISVFQHENVLGVQFHPEKSHRFGMEVLRHFAGSC
jgi:glutamine amidotransferase